ncbi:MAG TPA: C45 family peptidase, partial [Methanotrichaceae archaeon]|nr:C45 family peptidase [Methanotrichaceae archaeon]
IKRFAILAILTAALIAPIYQPAMAEGSGNDASAAVIENGGSRAGYTASDAMTPVAAFEKGLRYKAGTYDVIVLNGSYKEMGRQYGALMKDELQSAYGIITNSTSKRGYAIEQIRDMGHKACAYQPERMKAIYAGMAETSGLTKEDAQALYYGAVFYIMLPNTTETSCSFLAAWGNYTPDGALVVSRNWDLPDLLSVFDPYYVLVIYNPDDGSNSVATFGPAGIRPETLMNSAGLFIADNNDGGSGGSLAFDDRPELISQFFRFMLDYSTLEQLNAGIMSTRPDCPWIVNVAGPEKAYSYEENAYDLKRREGPGIIAATNHFIDPTWHLEYAPDSNSVARLANLQNLSRQEMGHIDPANMMKIRDVLVQDGGATFEHYEMGGMKYSTDHQVVFVPSTLALWIKTLERAWQEVDLKPLFG